ncbi:MAG TPA: MFS transporter [Paucimonas sp.]|nr:MFS transporter [Paucimonas sp.]
MPFDSSAFVAAELPSRMRRAAAPLQFFLLGMVIATWAARIPALRDALQLSAAQLGVVLLSGGVGAVLSFPLAAGLIARAGARRATLYSGLGLLLALPAVAAAPDMPLLMAAMVAFGAAASCFDVAINAAAAEAERVAGRSIMSLLHAWFCLGTFGGALSGGAVAGAGIAPLAHYGATALLLALPLALAFRALPCDRPDATAGKKRFAVPHGPLIALGVIGFCGAVAEGSITDWSGIYMKDQLRVSDGVAPLAFAAFSAMMFGMRLVADRLKDRFGARRIVAAGAALAALAIFGAAAAIDVASTIACFAAAGAGLAAVFPFVFSAAGRHGATALAGVATMGYSGGLIGPPVIGFIAHGFGLQAALAFVGLLSAAIAAAALKSSWLE